MEVCADLYSDTHTKPSPAMRQAIFEAEVGDEQSGTDPTTHKIEERAASLLGMSRAVFMPSATMCNQVAIRLHCRPGEELIAYENCHLFFAEAGGPAANAGVMIRPIVSGDGTFTPQDVEAQHQKLRGPHFSPSRMLGVENTTNMGGGVAWEPDQLKAVVAKGRELGLRVHLDGARLFNAAVATGKTAAELCQDFHTVTLCLSKGLGCPTGAILAFDDPSWEEDIRRLKQRMGGALRQSGLLAAAGLYAFDHNVDRLKEDHENARVLAALLHEIPALKVENPEPSTNMVFFGLKEGLGSQEFAKRCAEAGVLFSEVGEARFRAVTHLDVSREGIEKGVQALAELLA